MPAPLEQFAQQHRAAVGRERLGRGAVEPGELSRLYLSGRQAGTPHLSDVRRDQGAAVAEHVENGQRRAGRVENDALLPGERDRAQRPGRTIVRAGGSAANHTSSPEGDHARVISSPHPEDSVVFFPERSSTTMARPSTSASLCPSGAIRTYLNWCGP